MNVQIVNEGTGQFQISTGIKKSELKDLGLNKKAKSIQFASPLKLEEIEMLENYLFSKRPDILLRVFGHYSTLCDLTFLRKIPSLRKFSADCLMEAKGIETVSELKNLEVLGVGIYNLESFEFLENINSNIKELYLEKTKSKKPKISMISRFSQLESLYLESQQKGIEVINSLKKLKKITLRSITTRNLEYLENLNELWRIELKLGGIKEFDSLKKIPNLKYLELWQIRGLNNLNFISELFKLQMLSLQSLRNVESFPDLSNLNYLRRVGLENMKNLNSLERFRNCKNLKEFIFYDASNFEPKSILPLLENPSLENISCWFGSNRKNNEFKKLVTEFNKSTEIKEFEINTVPNTV